MNRSGHPTHPASLWEGFWGIQLLHAGQSLGLFSELEQARTPSELASSLKLETRYTDLWCSAATACGLIEQCESGYRVPEALRGWLSDSKGFTESHLHLSHRLNETFQAVFAGRALPEPPISLRLILADSLLRNYRWVFEEVPELVPLFANVLQTGTRALEVGCGIGLGLGVLRSHYSHLELYGLESDFECAREAERATRAVIHLGEFPGDRFGKTFDVIVCFRALASCSKPEELLAECAKLLAPNGWLVIGSEMQDQGGLRKSSARSLGELFAYQLLAGETEVNYFTREGLGAMLDRFNLKIGAEVEAPDWGTPVYLCTHRAHSKTA